MSNLPPLPQPYDGMLSADGDGVIDGFTADQLKAFAEEAVRLEREEANKLRDTLMLIRNHTSVTANQIEMIDATVRALWDQRWTAAIRARSQEGDGAIK
jgi:hypothetical protein